MKIKEYYPSFNANKHHKEIEAKINYLLSGRALAAKTLNDILKYLGYDDEEVICLRDCSEYTYSQYNSGAPCSVASSNYVKILSAEGMTHWRNFYEDQGL